MPSPSPDIRECVLGIEELLAAVIAIQRPHVLCVCAACPEPCCARVQHLFDEKDIFFLRLSGRKADVKRGSRKGLGCLHHTRTGCSLDPMARPFSCHRYLCEPLAQSIARSGPAILTELHGRLDDLDRLRSLLWRRAVS